MSNIQHSRLVAKLAPSDQGAPHDAYFRALNETCKQHIAGQPTLLIDLERLDHNIEVIKRNLSDQQRLRIVVKSLPCPDLLRYIATRTQCNKFMVFHRPFMNHIAALFPEANLLLGKPMPVSAVVRFYEMLSTHSAIDGARKFEPETQLQWLIDDEQRLLAYLEFAKAQHKQLLINLEIDVGLHRGGVKTPAQLTTLLRIIEANPQHLRFAGLMGYNPHVVKVPNALKSQQRALQDVADCYEAFKQCVQTVFANQHQQSVCFNGAGSPTYALYKNNFMLNDISIGSAFIKPSDFDLETLADHLPAVFIATPVLKKLASSEIPALERLTGLVRKLNVNYSHAFYIYGGYWKAKPVSPAGLRYNRLIGRSSNQELLNGSAATNLQVDDYVFLRPTQSEGVLLQFGPIAALRNGTIVEFWPVLTQTN